MIFLQRDASNAADVHFTGEQARILKDGSVVRDWTGGGVIGGVPQGSGYTLEVVKNGQVVTDTLAIGMVVGTIGQSNMGYWYSNGTPSRGVVDASPETFQLKNGEWATISGDAARTFANALAASTSVPVALVDGSFGSTSLLAKYTNSNGNWQSTAEGSLYDRFLDKLNVVGGHAELVLWIQGENDARAGATTAEYLDGLNDLFARLRADVGPTAILASKLGTTIYGDPQWSPYMAKDYADAVRLAQTMADEANGDVTFLGADDLSLQDPIHRTTVSSAIEGLRLLDAYLSKLGVDPIFHSVAGTDGQDALAGSSGMDFVDAGAGDDTIDAGAGNDLVRGGDGADTIDGGDGNDLLSGGLGADRILGGAGNDRITGDEGDDRIEAGAGNDVVAGGFGHDEIHGGDGDDVLEGGLGDDAVFGDAGNDTIKLGGGNDRIDAGDGDDVILVENFSHSNYSGPGYGISSVEGGAGYDVLQASANKTVIALNGLSGVELVTAGGFTGVTLTGSNAADTFDLRSTVLDGIDAIDMGEGDDSVFGSAAADRISGGAGADRLTGEGGNDVLIGGDGDDVMDGGEGIDFVQMVGRFSDSTIDRATGRIANAKDGVDTVSNVEFVNFLDGVYDWVNDRFDPTPPFSGVRVDGTSGNDIVSPLTSVGKQA
ncbi:sialate O-acetylesterase, partial [Aureimonas leprariae]